MTMTYKEALQVIHHMQQGTKLEAKEVNEAVEVIFANARKLTHLEKRLDTLLLSIRNKNNYIKLLQNELEGVSK